MPKKADDQAKMYDALTPLFDDVKRADLLRNFKSAKLGIKGQGRMRRERVPRKGVRIFRDKFNVPHIYGRTNDDVTWGAGWVVAQRPRAAPRAGALQRSRRGRGRAGPRARSSSWWA